MPNYLSSIRYTFVPTGGSELVLQAFNEEIGDHPQIGAEAQSATFVAIGAAWGTPEAMGGATHSLSWSRRVVHATTLAAQIYCRTFQAMLPLGKKGILREEIENGPTFEYADAVLLAAPTTQHPNRANETVTMVRIIAGKVRPVANLPLTPGLPWDWLVSDWEDMAPNWEAL